jgi:hypothetical protein
MFDHLPARPSLPATYWTVLPTLLLGSLPSISTWLSSVWPLAKQLRAILPEWAAAGLPVLALLGIGFYTIFLQWFDRRKYDEMQSRWNGLAEQNGFPPLAIVALQGAPKSVKALAEVARQKGSFVVSVGEAKTSLAGGATLDVEISEGKCLGWIRKHDGEYLVHPDLLKTQRG